VAYRLDALQEAAALSLVDQRDQRVADLDAERIDRGERLDALLRRGGRTAGIGQRLEVVGPALAAVDVCREAEGRGHGEEGEFRQAGHQAHREQHRGADGQRLHLREQLRRHVFAERGLRRRARRDEAARHRHEQCRNRRDQALAHRQDGEGLGGVDQLHVVLHDADHQTGDDVDAGDQQGGQRVSLGEADGAVHRAVELGFLADVVTPPLRFLLVDRAGVEIGVDRHLLARHRVEGEPRRHFRDAHRAVVDDHVLDGDQHEEHDDADHEVAAHHELAERHDDVAGGVDALVAVQQDEPRAGDVERQPQQRQQQEQRREDRELDRVAHVDRGEQQHDRQRDVDRQQQVHQDGRQRQHHQSEHQDDDARHHQLRWSERLGGGHVRSPLLRAPAA
jgi:hypothetical protein